MPRPSRDAQMALVPEVTPTAKRTPVNAATRSSSSHLGPEVRIVLLPVPAEALVAKDVEHFRDLVLPDEPESRTWHLFTTSQADRASVCAFSTTLPDRCPIEKPLARKMPAGDGLGSRCRPRCATGR